MPTRIRSKFGWQKLPTWAKIALIAARGQNSPIYVGGMWAHSAHDAWAKSAQYVEVELVYVPNM